MKLKITDLKVGEKVKDTWFFKRWGVGVIDQVLKTRVYIQFSKRPKTIVYDSDHIKYLVKVDYDKTKNKKNRKNKGT